MGYNTTVVVMNDSLHAISRDSEFGKKLSDAVTLVRRGKQDVHSGWHVNAATVIETHHADSIHLVAVGGNVGEDLGYVGHWMSDEIEYIKELAAKHGYTLRKKPKKKSI